jgi:hypothetical protein
MNKFLKLSIIGASALMVGGCKKFVDVNTNPNTPTETRAQWVFTGGLGQTYRMQVSTFLNFTPGTWAGYYAHSTSFTGGGNEKGYQFTASDFNAYDNLFDNLNDYEYVKNNADKDGVPFWKNPSDVMQCYVWQQLVDLYGDVPYQEALKPDVTITPKFTNDNGKTVYENLVVRLDSAMARMKRESWPADALTVNQDIMFQGNRDNWIRFANTLKLRILMRQSFMPGRDAYITTNINNTLANGYITQNVTVNPGYQVIRGKLNPFYENFGYNELNIPTSNYQYRKMNAVIMNWLKTSAVGATVNSRPPSTGVSATANADTFRLQALAYPQGATPTTSSSNLNDYIGVPMGIGSGYATAGASPIGPFMIVQGQGTRPGMFMLLSEALFLQAEAAQRYGITFAAAATPQALYEAGIMSHFRTLFGVLNGGSILGNASNGGDIFAVRYYTRSTLTGAPSPNYVNFTESPDPLRSILIQKWVSLCHVNGLEGWSEYRKSNGTPQQATPYSPKTLVTGVSQEPVRYLYPQSEINVNPNTPPQPTGDERFNLRIFWDVN